MTVSGDAPLDAVTALLAAWSGSLVVPLLAAVITLAGGVLFARSDKPIDRAERLIRAWRRRGR
jgi:hypothetical protein